MSPKDALRVAGLGPPGCGALLLISGFCGVFVPPSNPDPTATAVLIQPNLDLRSVNNWQGTAWDSHIAEFIRLAEEQCKTGVPNDRSSSLGWKTYIAGIPQTGAPTGEIICPPYPTHPDLVVWPVRASGKRIVQDRNGGKRPCGCG